LLVVLLKRSKQAMGEEEPKKNGSERTNKYAVACSIIGSIISILMGYGNQNHACLYILSN
jgi:hypothetical protein